MANENPQKNYQPSQNFDEEDFGVLFPLLLHFLQNFSNIESCLSIRVILLRLRLTKQIYILILWTFTMVSHKLFVSINSHFILLMNSSNPQQDEVETEISIIEGIIIIILFITVSHFLNWICRRKRSQDKFMLDPDLNVSLNN